MKINMVPTDLVRLNVGEAIAAAPPFAQAVDALVIGLIQIPFVADGGINPSRFPAVAPYGYANFDGYAVIPVGLNAQQVGVEPVTGRQVITLVPPVGGWRWEVSGPTHLPQTIYGVACVTNPSVGASIYVGSALFPVPYVLVEAGDEIVLGALQFPIALQPIGV